VGAVVFQQPGVPEIPVSIFENGIAAQSNRPLQMFDGRINMVGKQITQPQIKMKTVIVLALGFRVESATRNAAGVF